VPFSATQVDVKEVLHRQYHSSLIARPKTVTVQHFWESCFLGLWDVMVKEVLRQPDMKKLCSLRSNHKNGCPEPEMASPIGEAPGNAG
jgi:hypothetical protein